MITKEQLQKLANECAESITSDTDAGTAAEYGFIAGFEAAQRLLQQTQCTTQLPLPELNKCCDCESSLEIRKWDGVNYQCHSCYKDDKHFEDEYS